MSNRPYTYEQLDFLRRANEIDRFRNELQADSTELELDMAEYALDCEVDADEPVPYAPTEAEFPNDFGFRTIFVDIVP